MTLYESEVEWLRDELDESAIIKSAIWTDEEFVEFVSERGLLESLRLVTGFHANIADQLRSRGVTSPSESEWAKKTISLCSRAKRRRQELRNAVRNRFEDGDAIIREITAEIKEDWA